MRYRYRSTGDGPLVLWRREASHDGGVTWTVEAEGDQAEVCMWKPR